MPLTDQPYGDRVTRPYFAGLLPDETARRKLAGALGVSEGNADAHAKNVALLYSEASPDLAPLYDVGCTAAYKRLSKKLAMAIGGRNIPDTIQLQHWLSPVPDTRGAQRMLVGDFRSMADNVGTAADTLLAELEHEGAGHPILNDVRRVIDSRARILLQTME